jgi:hypothetical protein
MFKRVLTTVRPKDHRFIITMEIIPVCDTFYFITKVEHRKPNNIGWFTIISDQECYLSDYAGKKIRDLPLEFNFTDQEIYNLYDEIQLENVKNVTP